ncbi:MAG: FtsX-like permease family protein [Acidimicrobiales bacterium]
MRGQVVRVAWYRFRATFGRHWGGYLSIVLLIALAGGIGMGSLAAARRTQASFSVFLKSTNPSDLTLSQVYGPNISEKLARLPGVEKVKVASNSLTGFTMRRDGAPLIAEASLTGTVSTLGSLSGEYFDQDRVTLTQGSMADPKLIDECVATAQAEKMLGWHLGEVLPMGFYTLAQSELPDFGTAKVKPHLRVEMKLTGTVVFNNEVVLDDVDRFPTYVLFTPALTQRFQGGMQYLSYGLKLRAGAGGVSAVELEIIAALPRGTTYTFHVTSVVAGQVNRTVKPDAIALGVFGAIAMLAAVLIAMQMIARQLQAREEDLGVLRALGASRAAAVGDELLGILGAVVLGSLVAAAVAVGLSPLSPIGPVRAVYPSPGVALDFTVLGFGLLVLIGTVGAVAIALGIRSAPGSRRRGRAALPARSSGVGRLAARWGAPVSAVEGVRFALEPGRGRTAVPVRSALFGTALAVVIVTATLSFGSSLDTLVSHPALFGWNWNYAVSSNYLVPRQSWTLLDKDPDVQSWSGVSFADVQIDGLTVPVLLAGTHAYVTPPILSGHPLEANDQIVLGAATLAELHRHVGEFVIASYGTPKDAPVYVPPTSLRIVGTATLPAVGVSQTLHTSMGTGAMIPVGLEPLKFQKFLTSPDPTLVGPAMALVRLRPGVSPAAGLANMRQVAEVGNKALLAVPDGGAAGASVSVLSVQYPAEIENYRTIGDTPLILAGGLAVSAIVALGLTLVASVRRRRRDLALLKSLGFTQRQLNATVAWQATVISVIGVVIGIPLGIALGRWLWVLFAREIYAVPLATVPVLPLVLVGLSALVLANAVAGLPGRYAARTPTALVLRAE